MEQYKKHHTSLLAFLILLIFSAGAAAQFAFYKAISDTQVLTPSASEKAAEVNLQAGQFLLCQKSFSANTHVSCQFLSTEFLPREKCNKQINKKLADIEKKTGAQFPRIEGDCDRAYRDPRFNNFELTGRPVKLDKIILK